MALQLNQTSVNFAVKMKFYCKKGRLEAAENLFLGLYFAKAPDNKRYDNHNDKYAEHALPHNSQSI